MTAGTIAGAYSSRQGRLQCITEPPIPLKSQGEFFGGRVVRLAGTSSGTF